MRKPTLGYASNHLHFLLTYLIILRCPLTFLHPGTSNEQSHGGGFLPITQNDTGEPPIKWADSSRGLECCAPINNHGPQLKFLIISTRVPGAKQPNKGIQPPIQCSKDFGGGNNCQIVIVIQWGGKGGGQTSFFNIDISQLFRTAPKMKKWIS
jgi:hypothetical protein